MKKYTIRRTDPVHGRITGITITGDKEFITEEMGYGSCMDWIERNQKDVKIFKIAKTLHRRNGKRRLFKSIYAEDANEAIRYFDKMEVQEPDVTYQLLTGDWKVVACFMVRNGERELTTIV